MDVTIPTSMELLEYEMDSLTEEGIWRRRRERVSNALAAAQTAEGQDPAKTYAAARVLADVIEGTGVEEFIFKIETLAYQTDLSAIFNFMGLSRGSLLHIAAATGKDDILRLLLALVSDHLIAAQNEWGDTSLHMAAKAGRSRAAARLIHRARYLLNVEDDNWIPRMKNNHGNTALHEAVLNRHVDMVRLLLSEDLESVYLKNGAEKSPLYLALDTKEPAIHEVFFSLPLEPSRIEGLPPIHGVIVRNDYGLVAEILKKNMKLFAMTDSRGGNVFHLAAYTNQGRVFEFLLPGTEYLAQERDMNGDLPIHIASKMGHVELIKKLHQESHLLNRRGQTVLHVAAKYGRNSAVRYILRHPELGKLINERDYAGNTPLHLAAMHSQPASLFPLVRDERIQLILLNHQCLTALDIALDRMRREYKFRKLFAVMMLGTTSNVNPYSLVLRPETRDEVLSTCRLNKKKRNMDNRVNDVINTRLLVATLVATVTFAAGFAVPGGFNSSDTASKDHRGMATMLNNGLFQAFVFCNTIAMFCSMTAVVHLIWAQQTDVYVAIAAYQHTKLLLIIALPAMFSAFFTGVTLTVGKLPWLAHSIFYLGLVFLLIISGAMFKFPPFFQSQRRPIRLLMFWIVLARVHLWGIKTYPLDDLEEDGTADGTSAS